MELTGKCKEAFKGWAEDNGFYTGRVSEDIYTEIECGKYNIPPRFKNLTDSMQYGVYVDFSETVEDITNHKMVEAEQGYIAGGHTRKEARTFTVEKFDKRFNQNK